MLGDCGSFKIFISEKAVSAKNRFDEVVGTKDPND
jgi:hypothetical protein